LIVIATPWALYEHVETNFVGGEWLDSSGNGRHASTLIGSGPIVNNRTLTFTPTNGLQFPAGSIPSSFTIVVVARVVPTASIPVSIFSMLEANDWFLGWEASLEATASFSTPKTPAGSGPSFKFRKIAASNDPASSLVLVDEVRGLSLIDCFDWYSLEKLLI
jgi:hypothetical protein